VRFPAVQNFYKWVKILQSSKEFIGVWELFWDTM